MTRPFVPLLAVLPLLLSACSLLQSQSPTASTEAKAESGYAMRNGQFDFDLASGDYSCEHGVRVGVQREMQASVNNRVNIRWNGRQYQLQRDPTSYSGLPRFEDPVSRLVWIDLPWKSVLLDGRTHKPIASECQQLVAGVGGR